MRLINEHFHQGLRQSENIHLPLNLWGMAQHFPYTNLPIETHLNGLISRYTNWFEPRKENRLDLSVDAVPMCVFEWQTQAASTFFFPPALNYTALQNTKLICHNKTIVDIFVVVMFNAALWSDAVST